MFSVELSKNANLIKRKTTSIVYIGLIRIFQTYEPIHIFGPFPNGEKGPESL